MHAIDLTIPPRETDLGGFSVRRLLPYAQRRMVGPFIFFDHLGPAHFDAGHGIDVRPHPHIGLSTVTYLFDGSIYHRDSLGSRQSIAPGAVNWMTAGRGIAHSERTEASVRAHAQNVHGLQSWVALPREFEDTPPSFHHHVASSLPRFTLQNVSFTLIAGRFLGEESPVTTHSPLFYAEVVMPAGAAFTLPAEYHERALYLIEGAITAGGTEIAPLTLPVFAPGEPVRIEARTNAHLMLLGGEPFSEPRFIWWNFVATTHERIEQAKLDWKAGTFGTVADDTQEFIPLPE